MVEVFADVACPFTHVGLRRLVARRDHLGRDDVVLRVRAWPLELVNGAAPTGDVVAEEIEVLREVVAPDLFQGFDPTRFPRTTIPALALTASAYRRDERTGEAVSLALRTALFEEGRDIGDRDELAMIARSFRLVLDDPDAERWVHEDWHEGERRGVIGSPHFFVGEHAFFCPTLEIARVKSHLEIGFDRDAFNAFSAVVFDRGDEV